MKIAFIGEAISGFGGMETVIRDVIDSLQSKNNPDNCMIYFFCRNNKMDKKWLNGLDVSYHYSKQKISWLRRRSNINNLSRWLVNNQPDIIISFDMISCLFAKKAKEKIKYNIPVFSWAHFSLDHKKKSEYIVCADYHLAISSGISNQLIKRGVSPSSISLIFNPVTKKKSIISYVPENDKTTHFLYVGRIKIEGQKRIKDLLDGLSEVNGKWCLHIVGDGADLKQCQEYAKLLRIDTKIVWYGWQQDPWQFIAKEIPYITALVMTSAFEGFSMVLLEALSFGIPCISSNCISGPEDIIINGQNGYLYELGNQDDLVRKLNIFINNQSTVDRENIPNTINKFYSNNYYNEFNNAITKWK